MDEACSILAHSPVHRFRLLYTCFFAVRVIARAVIWRFTLRRQMTHFGAFACKKTLTPFKGSLERNLTVFDVSRTRNLAPANKCALIWAVAARRFEKVAVAPLRAARRLLKPLRPLQQFVCVALAPSFAPATASAARAVETPRSPVQPVVAEPPEDSSSSHQETRTSAYSPGKMIRE